MAPSPSVFPFRHLGLGLAAGLVSILAAACEPSSEASHDDLDAAGSFTPDAGPAPAVDGGTSTLADAAVPPTSREIELARMQAHLDSLYAQSDVVHRFTTAGGDPVDCVPFQKQPGFAQVGSMNGAAPVLDTALQLGRPAAVAGFGDGLDGAGNVRLCPAGAVPIRHYGLRDLARFATLQDFLAKEPVHVLDQVDGVGFSHEHGAHLSFIPNWGAQTTLNVWNPAVEPNDFSLSQLWVVGGTNAQTQTVEAGYTAFPTLHGDAESRLFIYSTTDNYDIVDTTNCYDLTCKAFVQLADSHILIGGKFDKTSVMNGEQREFSLRWQFCPATECKDWEGWWLRYEGGATSEWVGFYPRKRYAATGLRDKADRIDFGGEVAFVRGKAHTTTDMGSGQAPAAGFGAAAYQINLLRITPEHTWAVMGTMSDVAQAPSCYASGTLTTAGRIGIPSFFFGGAGFGGACK